MGVVFPTSRGVRAELRRRRTVAARLVLVSAAPLVGLAVATAVFDDGGGAALLGAVVFALLLLPGIRAARIAQRGRGHFQPFQLVLLMGTGLVQVVAGAVAFAAGSPGGSALLLVWAAITAVAARQVQRSQLVT